jgi:hypothetical protein
MYSPITPSMLLLLRIAWSDVESDDEELFIIIGASTKGEIEEDDDRCSACKFARPEGPLVPEPSGAELMGSVPHSWHTNPLRHFTKFMDKTRGFLLVFVSVASVASVASVVPVALGEAAAMALFRTILGETVAELPFVDMFSNERFLC